MTILERLFRALDFLYEHERLVRVKTWMPYYDGRYLCWPSFTVDKPGMFMHVSPCWDRVRFRNLWRKALRARSTKSGGEGCPVQSPLGS